MNVSVNGSDEMLAAILVLNAVSPVRNCHFSGYLHHSSMATPYVYAKSTETSWAPKVYHKTAAKSLSHCAVLCRMRMISDMTCNLWSWDGTDCFLGRHDYTGVAASGVPSGISVVYTDPGMAFMARICKLY